MDLNNLGLMHTNDADLLIARLRGLRDRLLVESDWAMMPDAPTDKEAWATYRQALRDFPATWEPNEIAELPSRPA